MVTPPLMDSFNLKNAPLEGVTLIEAGAGTGKTYTLAGLVLRLIVEKGLGIEQILVVTYTKAATEELKTRIRDRLNAARQAFEGKPPQDEMLDFLVTQTRDPHMARQRIAESLTNFDRAAIFTIHGFCQRLLQHYAFETGHLFQSELVQDSDPLSQEMVADFWRRHIASAPYELARFALRKLKDPGQLSRVIHYCAYPDVKIQPEGKKPALRSIKLWREEADHLQRQWRQDGARIMQLLREAGLHARFYGKCEPHPEQPAYTHRQFRLLDFTAYLDSWNGKYPLDAKLLKYLCASTLRKYTKKAHTTPEHPFFDRCESAMAAQELMEGQMERYLRYLKIRLLQQAHEVLDRKKQRKNILFFDDLLLLVHQALKSENGLSLVKAVKNQYRAALVDEFQDTDLVQYEIFQHLFSAFPQLLFMIGDPKQAIYSFRGADLFSYLKASENARRSTTLTRNWRSTPDLVQAVNTMFEGHPSPFGFQQIRFNPAVAARNERSPAQPPMTLWYLTRTQDDTPSKPISQEEATQSIAMAVAEEIVRLLNDPGEGFEPRQIAVLTRTHAQSQIIKRALSKKRVPAVLHSAGSVFDTEEAEALLILLEAVANPYDAVKVRAALAQKMFGLQAHTFHQAMETPDTQWQERWTNFYHDHRMWVRRGVYPMMRVLTAREKIKSKLLSLPDGERALTNFLHLCELLHEAEGEHGLGPEGLVKWLAGQRQSIEGGDERQLRLESDARALRIITMHKSKGLQFDVVFCPYTWGGIRVNKDAVVFHDPLDDNQLTLTIGPDIPRQQQMAARQELLAENLRMLYVAVTRAKERCYLVWGRINGTELSAPAYLFHGAEVHPRVHPKVPIDQEDRLASLVQKMKSLTDGRLIEEIGQLSIRSDEMIRVGPLPRSTDSTFKKEVKERFEGRHRILEREISAHWPMASFSSLTASTSKAAEVWPDHDSRRGDASSELGAVGYDTLFDFPKGAHAGLFFHDLLEHWDHTCDDAKGQRHLVLSKLKAYGFEAQWQKTVDRMLNQLSKKRLRAPAAEFSFSQVRQVQRLNEMEFYFPLKRFTSDQIMACFQQFGDARFSDAMDSRLERINFAPEHGYMKGFIDMVFQHDHQYFLVDWKSNHLGNQFEAYDPQLLNRPMVADDYFLQYHLYAVALNRLLSQKVGGYHYDRHFGGVFYIFLRGLTDSPAEGSGIFFAKPEVSLIAALDRLMIATE